MGNYIHTKVCDVLAQDNSEPVGPTAELFREKVLATLPGIKLAQRNGNSFHVYRDDCPYTLGWIGYGVYSASSDKTAFAVHARTITNNKYSEKNPRYHTRMTTNLYTAVRNAKKFLRKYNPIELADVNMPEVSSAIYHHEQAVINAPTMVLQKLFTPSLRSAPKQVLDELRRVLDSGWKFTHPEFELQLREYFTLAEKAEVYKNSTYPMWFVHAYQKVDGITYFDIVDIDDVQQWEPVVSSVGTFTEDTLPEEVMGKICVLNIAEDGEYIESVGYKDGNMFYAAK
jgi:hypothetical protein